MSVTNMGNMDKTFKKVADSYGLSVEDFRTEVQSWIDDEYGKMDFAKKYPGCRIPTPEEYIMGVLYSIMKRHPESFS